MKYLLAIGLLRLAIALMRASKRSFESRLNADYIDDAIGDLKMPLDCAQFCWAGWRLREALFGAKEE